MRGCYPGLLPQDGQGAGAGAGAALGGAGAGGGSGGGAVRLHGGGDQRQPQCHHTPIHISSFTVTSHAEDEIFLSIYFDLIFPIYVEYLQLSILDIVIIILIKKYCHDQSILHILGVIGLIDAYVTNM